MHIRPGDNGESEQEKVKELALYRLQQLGLLIDYTKEYQPNNFVHYSVQRAENWTAQSVAEILSEYLSRSGLAAGDRPG